MIYLSADVGGTFTDLVLIDSDSGRTLVEKLPSDARGHADSIAAGIALITKAAGVDPGELNLFVHGFTVATNAFLTRKGGRVALIVTEGFADVLEIADQRRPMLYSLRQQKAPTLVARADVVEVQERLDAFGGVVAPLQEREIARVADAIAKLSPDAVAVCLNFSFLNDRHERLVAGALAEAFQGLPVYRSSVVNPQIEEYPRANTTAMAAYVGPVVDRYLTGVEANMAGAGARCPLRLMRSDGGIATPRAARANPAHLMLSGPAGGVIAATALGRRLGRPDLVTFDMGGTSADFAVITDGEARSVRERAIGGQPLRLPSLDIETISAGGGSMAWVDRGGALKVGPDSAGAAPGPACYGQGGEAPTVTDAAVVLGLIDPAQYLGGRMQLDAALAAAAIRLCVAEPLGLTIEEAASGIVAIASAQMIKAIRSISVERGLDARRYSLLAFGGAGPLFAPYLAAGLEMREVIVPRYPGVFCAEGLLMTDIRHTAQVAYRRDLARISVTELDVRIAALRAQLDQELAADGIAPGSREFRLFGDLRYVGQFHELEIDLRLPGDREWWDARVIARRFHEAHQRAHGHSDADNPIELVNLRAVGAGLVDRPPAAPVPPEEPYEPEQAYERLACLERGQGPVSCRHFDRVVFRPGARIAGPALIHQLDSTVLVLPQHRARAVGDGTLVITQESSA